MDKFFIICGFIGVISCFDVHHTVKYFEEKNVGFVVGFLCKEKDSMGLSKDLANAGISSNFPAIDSIKTASDLWQSLYYPWSKMTGVVVDLSCPKSTIILTIASNNRFFDITRHWLVYINEPFTKQDFEESAYVFEPKMFDVHEYLEFRNPEMEFGSRIREINLEVNADLLEDPVVVAMMEDRNVPRLIREKDKKLELFVSLMALVDSEVTLAVPTEPDVYQLYATYRYTIHSKMLIEDIGTMEKTEDGKTLKLNRTTDFGTSSVNYRKDFNGTIMRGVAGLLHYEYLSKSTEPIPTMFDHFAMRQLQISILAEQRYNFRMLVKTFDDYGWFTNGSYNGALRHLAEFRADMSSGGFLLYTSRMGAIDFVDSMLPVPIGLVFKAPALSQVANIFILPFATNVWLCAFGLALISGLLLFFQFRAIRSFRNEEQDTGVNVTEVFTFLTGAAFQQGTDVDTTNVSARLTMLVFLVSSLFLFTSYTANIVALLQSPSDSIKTIRDFVDSSLEMGFENLPYQEKLVEEDNDALIREMDDKKLAANRALGLAYLNGTIGMEKVRQSLYAFHLELSTAGRIVSDTYPESDKCRLKVINLFPNRFNGHAVPKHSPYYELLAQAYRWYWETGFTDRTNCRFTYTIPKCSGQGTGFNSIALSDINEIMMMMVYGCGLSLLLLGIEHAIYFVHHRQKKSKTPEKVKQMMKKHNVTVFKP